MPNIEIAGYNIEVKYKKIKRLYLRVRPSGEIVLSVPYGTREDYFVNFVKDNLVFIQNSLKKIAAEETAPQNYQSGEIWTIHQEKFSLSILENQAQNICYLQDKQIIMELNNSLNTYQKKLFLINFFQELLAEEIKTLLPIWQEKTNLYARTWTIKNMSSRWGSCNPKTAKLCFNLQLIHQPLISLEYIILHELTHLIEPSHNQRFCNFLSQYMPNWREIRQALNSQPLISY